MSFASRTSVLFLGTDSVVPSCGQDTASFVLNGKYLVDTGWGAALRMTCHGVSPLDIEYLFLTHCHHDHYIGLPQLLFYLAMRRSERPTRNPLKIVGPSEDLERIVGLSRQLLQPELFPPAEYVPDLIPFAPGDMMEDSEFNLAACRSPHPVPALCYRFTDKRTGKIVSFTGDTAYEAAIAEHVKGSDLLIHEASYGASDAPKPDKWQHSGAGDAARIALLAGVARLALVHCPMQRRENAVIAARSIFASTFWPKDGEIVFP